MSKETVDVIRCELRKERDRHIEDITKIVSENIKFDKESLYFYNCNGSGYYLRFYGVSGERVIFDIYSKGGIKKDKNFYINWCGIDEIKKIVNE